MKLCNSWPESVLFYLILHYLVHFNLHCSGKQFWFRKPFHYTKFHIFTEDPNRYKWSWPIRSVWIWNQVCWRGPFLVWKRDVMWNFWRDTICHFEWTRPLIGPRYRGHLLGAAIGCRYRGQPIRGLVHSKRQIMSFQ